MKWLILALIDQSLDRVEREREIERGTGRQIERQIYEMVNSSLDRSIFR